MVAGRVSWDRQPLGSFVPVTKAETNGPASMQGFTLVEYGARYYSKLQRLEQVDCRLQPMSILASQ
jgi:hypothetical protein